MKRFLFVLAFFIFLAGSVSCRTRSGGKYSMADSSATKNTRALFSYLSEIYGSQIITGQMENAWNDDCDMLSRVHEDTKKYPALMGFDFMNYTSLGWNAVNLQTERAINFWNGRDWNGNTIPGAKHGIVTFSWHWRDPMAKKGTTGEFYAEKADFRIPYDIVKHAWKTDTEEYKKMLSDMDKIAGELQKLQKAGVPVLWRPLHEGAGNVGLYNNTGRAWFWWGSGNNRFNETDERICGECYVALWRLMFDYFTKNKKLHNLIWVWNGQNKSFYPGDAYVDIVGVDIYDTDGSSPYKNHSGRKSYFETYTEGMGTEEAKLTAITECGFLPDPEACRQSESMWLFFMLWNDGAWDSEADGVSRSTSDGNFWSGEYYNATSVKTGVYSSDFAVTLDELPDFTK